MHSDWLLSRQDFLVMTGHYENFSWLDSSFELSKSYEHVGENKKNMDKVHYIFKETVSCGFDRITRFLSVQ